MSFRDYDPTRDKEAVRRIWHEIGWLEKGQEEALYTFLEGGHSRVAEVDGEAECQVQAAPGSIRYLEEELRFCAITAVTTSHVARKQGIPKRLMAHSLAEEVAQGAQVAGLGMFDQGFYDQLGFGTGPYEHWLSFDPATLRLPVRFRPPRRLTMEDCEAVHAARLARRPVHGRCNLDSPAQTRADLDFTKNSFGLGYCDGPGGELSHALWLSADNMGSGPYRVKMAIFHTREQFLDLMALLKGFDDQVRLINMRQPSGLQLQDLLTRPFRHQDITEKSRFENRTSAEAYWQMRILDLPGCLAKTHLCGEPVSFNLALRDPIETLLDNTSAWCGVGGEYVVTAGPESCAAPGSDASWPTLSASVGAFTRLWLGVRPATGLAYTDDLSGPPELLAQLDRAFRLPLPTPDWDF